MVSILSAKLLNNFYILLLFRKKSGIFAKIKRNTKEMRKSFVKVLWALLATGIGIVAVFFFLIWFGIVGYSPDIENLQNPISKSASQVFSADGKIIGTYNVV